MVSTNAIKAEGSIAFLARLLAACDSTSDPDYQDIKVTAIAAGAGRKVTAKLVAPSGDAYRVTVEWLSEESP